MDLPVLTPVTAKLADDDVVQVLMTEKMARNFEARCLGKGNTQGDTSLSPPVKFSEDDVPTYIIQVGP